MAKYDQIMNMSNAPPATKPGSSIEVQTATFADDPRIYFSKSNNTWRYEEEDGTEMEFDAAKGTWVPALDEDLVKQQQAAYSVTDIDEETPAAPVLRREAKKRKERDDSTVPASSVKKGRGEQKERITERKSKNTAVFITGLPPDTKSEELVERFSRCGVIEEDDEGEPKVKMYAKEDGTFNGDALVVYFKEDSVILALSILDEAELRLGDPGTIMKVEKADFTHKSATAIEYEQQRTLNKKKATKRIGKMKKKLQDWDVADGFGPMTNAQDDLYANHSSGRVVVLTHMFTMRELEDDTSLLLDLKEDVRDECSTLGEVTNVVLYDQEPEGIMTVKFRDPLSAQACVLKMNGRFFAGRRIEASLHSGKRKFKHSGGEDEQADDTEANKRLDDFGKWLISEGD
ncbi:hypothetical protein AX17_005605 [Amanita inopinata Kibby_2008]|nr:hypothetical protein AX17_005605 [Amanita inopinata Kibby_2008]